MALQTSRIFDFEIGSTRFSRGKASPLTWLGLFLFAASPLQAGTAEPVEVKVAVITMYEIGEYTGDEPGEYQFWIERENLTKIYPFPFGPHDLRMNEKGLMGICTGPGVSNAAIVITALGHDERFDFTKTYWIVSGIAGGDPADVSLGAAAWARWVVDGDLHRSIDSREAPGDWPYGIFPSGAKRPNTLGKFTWYPEMAWKLNPGLVQWAYELSKDVELTENPEVVEFRQMFEGLPKAAGPPEVVLGESLGSNSYWHGEVLTGWANDWVKLHTKGEGNFMMTNVEDNGTMRALNRLDSIGKVDRDRVLVLRTASNYSMQPPGETAEWSLMHPYPARGLTAKESCYRVPKPVVDALIEGWETYRYIPPSVE